MSAETWRDVVGFPNYRVSDQGRVWSTITNKFIRQRIDRRGYRVVQIRGNGRNNAVFVHRMVARAFCDGWSPELEVRHLDGDPGNNVPSNLKWGTHTENMHDMVRHGRNYWASKTHCIHGHEFTSENTILKPLRSGNVGRMCRTCYAAALKGPRSKPVDDRVETLKVLVSDPQDVTALQNVVIRQDKWLEQVRSIAVEIAAGDPSSEWAVRLRRAVGAGVADDAIDRGAVPHDCPECGLSVRKDTLKRHMRRRHGIRKAVTS